MRHCLKLLTLLLFFSCGQKETRKVVCRFDSGKENIIQYFPNKDDTLTYRKEVFFESGKQNYIGNIVGNKKEGVWTWWYENGKKKDQCTYLNGKEIDTIFHWYANGKLKQTDVIRQGKPSAANSCSVCCNVTSTKYYDDGKLKEACTRVDDKYEGTHIIYMENGGWKIRNYANDTLSGKTYEHLNDSDGVKLVAGQYKSGQETGIWSWRDKDSILYQTATYVNGKIIGEYKRYYQNGKIELTGFLSDIDKRDGKFSYYDTTGKLTSTEYWKEGHQIK